MEHLAGRISGIPENRKPKFESSSGISASAAYESKATSPKPIFQGTKAMLPHTSTRT